LLNSCYKIYTKILNEKLKTFSEEILTEPQCGFRRGCSCIDAVFGLKLLLEKRREFNLETYFLFLDYEKAFDQINRSILFNILQKRNVPNPLLTAIFSIHKHNKIRIRLDSRLSQPTDINREVCQGCPMSPTLFNIYVNEIISEWDNNDIKGLKISGNTEIKTLLFADDQVIMAESENLLQKSVHKLEKTTSKYGLTISTNKTKTMAFRG
jgi:hypothetical protein